VRKGRDKPSPNGEGRFPRLKVGIGALALLAGVLAAACSQGAYPLDFFYEMHYQQSYKSQEPPRLSPPESAVPRFPAPESTSFRQDGRYLFQVNCALCHGQDAKGTANKERGPGPVLKTMMEVYGYQEKAPTDLTLFPPDFIDGVLQFTSEPGRPRYFGEGSVMPVFAKLLTPQERQLIAQYIQTLRP